MQEFIIQNQLLVSVLVINLSFLVDIILSKMEDKKPLVSTSNIITINLVIIFIILWYLAIIT